MLAKTALRVRSFLQGLLWLPLALLEYIRKWLHFRRLANRFPGPRPWPLVGNIVTFGFPITAWQFMDFLISEVLHRHRQSQFWVGPFRLISLSDPEDIQCYLQNTNNQSKPPLVYDIIAESLGDGLVTRNEQSWRIHQRIITPAFHLDILNTYVPIFDKKGDALVRILSEHSNGTAFDMTVIAGRSTFAATIETLFGVPSDDQCEMDELIHLLDVGQKLFTHRLMRPFLYPSFVYKCTSQGRKFTKLMRESERQLISKVSAAEKLLEEAGKQGSSEVPNGKRTRSGFLHTLLMAARKGTISYQEVLEEGKTIILAAFDTTFITFLLTLYCLAKNPHIQKSVIMELKTLFKEPETTEVTVDKLQRMEYLEMVIKETLRLYPPVPFLARVTGTDTPLVTSDLVVPAGALVVISPKGVHTDPKIHAQPEVFNPERFSKENCGKMHPYPYFPFSAGQRVCIGKRFVMMELKTLLSKVLWNYEILPDLTYEPIFDWGVTAVPQNGVWLKMVKRL